MKGCQKIRCGATSSMVRPVMKSGAVVKGISPTDRNNWSFVLDVGCRDDLPPFRGVAIDDLLKLGAGLALNFEAAGG